MHPSRRDRGRSRRSRRFFLHFHVCLRREIKLDGRRALHRVQASAAAAAPSICAHGGSGHGREPRLLGPAHDWRYSSKGGRAGECDRRIACTWDPLFGSPALIARAHFRPRLALPQPDVRSVVMTKKGGKKYRCYLPHGATATRAALEDAVRRDAPPPHMATFLSPLIGTCFYRLEVCACVARAPRGSVGRGDQPLRGAPDLRLLLASRTLGSRRAAAC